MNAKQLSLSSMTIFLTIVMLGALPIECDGPMYALESTKKKLTVDGVKHVLLQDKKFHKDSYSGRALYSKFSNKKQFRCHICIKIGARLNQKKNKNNKQSKKVNS